MTIRIVYNKNILFFCVYCICDHFFFGIYKFNRRPYLLFGVKPECFMSFAHGDKSFIIFPEVFKLFCPVILYTVCIQWQIITVFRNSICPQYRFCPCEFFAHQKKWYSLCCKQYRCRKLIHPDSLLNR